MTKKQARLERERYTYWQGQLCNTHPWMHSLAPSLAEKFIQDQVVGRPYHGGLAKLVYWFLQGAHKEPLHPICLTVTVTRITSYLSTSRTLAAYLMQAPWRVYVRSITHHHDIICSATQLDTCPREFKKEWRRRPKTWGQDLKHTRRLLDQMTLNLGLEPLELLRSIQAQTAHLAHLAHYESSGT